MSQLVEIGSLFAGVRSSARRLETLDSYRTDDEAAPFAAFLAGEPVPLAWFTPWLDQVRAATSAGIRYERVRLYREPLSDYLRFELWTCAHNVEAGETISYLDAGLAAEHHLPGHDYWLLDDARLALMHFTEDGRPLGAVVTTDPFLVRSHRTWLDVAERLATPFADFTRAHPVHALAR